MTGKTYFNTASCGLLDEHTLQNTYAFYEAMLTESSTASEIARDQRLPQIRETVASFLNAPVANIAFVPNFSYALNSIVQALKGTEKVLVYRHDYPSIYEPFRINGFDITWIDSPDEFTIDIEEIKTLLLQHKIDILAISQVQWLSGFKIDIQELGDFCKEHNITFIVDATQSLGAVPVAMDRQYADAVIASNYKWMNAGFGSGIMYLSDRFMQLYPPVTGGHNSYAMQDGVWKYVPSVRSYEPGHLNLHGLMVLEAAVKQKMQWGGTEAIAIHNTALTKMLLDEIGETGLTLLGPATTDNRSAIVALKAGKALHQYLVDNHIITTWRDGLIRISIHFYNTKDDVQRLVACLKSYRQH